MNTPPHPTPLGEGSPDRGSYRQELRRTLGPLQVFAVSFAFISVAVGIFGTYDDVLQHSGPVAARIALTGSSYQWASRLANPRIGWGFGWMSFCYIAVGIVAVDNAMASQALMPLLGMDVNEGTARIITLLVLLIQTVLAIASTRIVGILNACAVGVEITLVGVLVVALVVAFATTGLGSVSNLTSRGITLGDAEYFSVGGGLMLAMIIGLSTLVGFDAAANLAEEAKEPFRVVPRAIVGSVIAAGVLGLLFLMALTVAIPDVARISHSGSPVADILRDQFGAGVERMLLVVIVFAFFACGMVTLATGSRLIYAMARERRFPAHRVMRLVDPRTQTPIPATLLLFAGGVLLMVAMPGEALLALITASTIVPMLIYAATVTLYLSVRRQLDRREEAFDLGRFELPVAASALVWLIAAIFVLVTSESTLVPVLIVGSLMLAGGVFFLGMLLLDRESLEGVPEAMKTSAHSPQ